MSRVISLIKSKCPKCEKGEVFAKRKGLFSLKIPKMNTRCSNCNHFFEREPGFFIGAMYVSYGLVLPELVTFFFVFQLFFTENTSIFLMLLCVVLLSYTNFRYSRLIWMYVFTPKAKE